MKDKVGLIIPGVMILFGVYALITTLISGSELVTLVSMSEIPRGLAALFGLLGLGGGVGILFSLLSDKKHAFNS